jgi:hypothetical protein
VAVALVVGTKIRGSIPADVFWFFWKRKNVSGSPQFFKNRCKIYKYKKKWQVQCRANLLSWKMTCLVPPPLTKWNLNQSAWPIEERKKHLSQNRSRTCATPCEIVVLEDDLPSSTPVEVHTPKSVCMTYWRKKKATLQFLFYELKGKRDTNRYGKGCRQCKLRYCGVVCNET